MTTEPASPTPPPRPVGGMSLGIEMATPVLVFGFLGYQADRWLDKSPWFTAVGGVLGIVVGFYSFYKRVLGGGDDRGPDAAEDSDKE